jgi:hypothetical protein
MAPAAERSSHEPPEETFDRLLRALTRILELAQQQPDNVPLSEWAQLAALDALDLGDQLGMLAGEAAERRSETMRAIVAELDQPPS